jgi:alkaline phosphatase D
VASGDPTTGAVILWTRVTTDEPSAEVTYEIARDRAFTEVVARGSAVAEADDDHTVHVDVDGLDAGTTYWYRFAAAGEQSPIGRTRTLPENPESMRVAFCSCAKFNAGFFNGYARMADRDDLDFVLHLGDYIYEASNKPPASQTPGADIGRPFEPVGECRTLAEYRTRYAQYHGDEDVQRLHARYPMVLDIDDHEFADGAWRGGSTEHHPDEHGPWEDRKAAAFRAREEWLPVRRPEPDDPTRVFRSVHVGDLAEFFLLDIRSRRDEPVRGEQMRDPDRTLLGPEQWAWLDAAFAASTARWRFVCSPSIVTRTWCDTPDEQLRVALTKLKIMDDTGEIGPDMDQWDGYPFERERLLTLLRTVPGTIVLSADVHVGMAGTVYDERYLPDDPVETTTVEWTAPSLTSQNLDEKLGYAPRTESLSAEASMRAQLPHVDWCDFDSHGYVLLEVDRDQARASWWHVDGVLERCAGETCAATFERVHENAGR